MKMSDTLIVAHKLYCLFNLITHFVPDLDSNQENNQGKRKLKKENSDEERSYLQVPEKGKGNKSTQSVKAVKNRQHSPPEYVFRPNQDASGVGRVVVNRDERRGAIRLVCHLTL